MLELEAYIIDKRSIENNLKEYFEQTEIVFELVNYDEKVKFLKTGRELKWWRAKYHEFNEPMREQKCIVKIPEDKFEEEIEYKVRDFYPIGSE